MARLSKEEQARQDGLEYAYKLVREGGLEALEQRVARNKKSFTPVFVPKSAEAEFVHAVKSNVCLTFMCISMMVLKDKFGFGSVRLTRWSEYFKELADSIDGEYLTYTDIYETLKAELGCDVIDIDGAAEQLITLDKQLSEARENS